MFVDSGLTVRLDETVPFADYCISKLVLIKQVFRHFKENVLSTFYI